MHIPMHCIVAKQAASGLPSRACAYRELKVSDYGPAGLPPPLGLLADAVVA